jgi:hypothetical protein
VTVNALFVKQARQQVLRATRFRCGDACMLGQHPPYVVDRNGWGLGFCELDYEQARLRWWYRG